MLPDGLKYGDVVKVEWSEPTLGGLTHCTLTKKHPVYGLHYENNDWYVYNGEFGKGRPWKGLLRNTDKNAKVVKAVDDDNM
jgi:hypothetical protein